MAMELGLQLFPEGGFVRLQSRVNGKYVHAEADWVGVTLRRDDGPGPAPSLNSVWRVGHWLSPIHGNTYVLLQNAAYGRYLSFTMEKAQRGHRGFRTAQLDRNDTNPDMFEAYPWTWAVERQDPPNQDYVTLRYYTCFLRANGRYLPWNIRVTTEIGIVDDPWITTTMMHWRVHPVAASPVPQPLPLTLEDEGSESGLLFPHPPRTIRHVRATDEGEFDQNHNNWLSFAFYDSSLIRLKNELGILQEDWTGDISAYTLCMRPGSHGRLMPLITDLPRSLDTVNIVVFRTGSPATAAFVYPAPPPPPQDAAAA